MKEEDKRIKAGKETLKEKKINTQKCITKKKEEKKSKYKAERKIRKKNNQDFK